MKELLLDLHALKDPSKAKVLQSFFKTNEGEYGAGDIFLGVTVPKLRQLVKKHPQSSLKDIQRLQYSPIHEERMLGTLYLVQNYSKDPQNICKHYLKHAKQVNNWDLVDVSCHKIVGEYLLNQDRKVLYKLAKSNNLWEKRIAIVSTWRFIRENQFNDTLEISKILLKDKHDLINKAVGWMFREVGKRDKESLEKFLKENLKEMPRVTLRYAIEKFPKEERLKYYTNNFYNN